MKMREQVPCFFVEGIPGVGKSTFVQLLTRHLPGIATAVEPIEKFDNTKAGQNPLELLLNDQKRWAFTVNMYITLMRYRMVKSLAQRVEAMDARLAIADRSMHSDLLVYVKMAHEEGNLSQLELEMYQEFFDHLVESAPLRPTAFIYLQATPEIALERLRLRNRASECNLPLAYEQQVERCYRQWLVEKKDIPASLAQTPVLVVDAAVNLRDDVAAQERCLEQVTSFIAQVAPSWGLPRRS